VPTRTISQFKGGPTTQYQQLSIMTTLHTDQLCPELQRTLIILSRVSELPLETRGECDHLELSNVFSFSKKSLVFPMSSKETRKS